MTKPTKKPQISDEMRRFIEEERDSDRLVAEGKLAPVSKHMQAKMESSGGAVAPGQETPWEQLQREEAEAAGE